ncbi:MAG: hypothetical protein QM784_23545 [Polyangiaceae bacterium]
MAVEDDGELRELSPLVPRETKPPRSDFTSAIPPQFDGSRHGEHDGAALLSSLAGYALAKYEFVGKKALMSYMLGSMMIPGVLLLAPIYAMAVKFNLVDSLSG